MRRPKIITGICWVLIIFSALGILGAVYILTQLQHVINLQLQHDVNKDLIYYNIAISVLSPIVNLIIAIKMLRGRNWARYVYLIFNVILYVIALILAPQKIFVGVMIIIFCVFIYFLFNAKATQFFMARSGKSAS